MAFDFKKIKAKKKEVLPIDPIEIFQKLKVSDQGINDLWLAQGDALREWHSNRLQSDISVVLNTGAGKTLVGLIIAQSLVNESKEKVLYVCSSIQLVKQTTDKADGYGLKSTTYYRGDFSNDLFHKGKACCITTYQALFNGRSIFFNEEVSAIIFDDAHAAEHLLRDHFSVRIDSTNVPAIYSELVALFRDYFESIGNIGSYEELTDETCQNIFLLPPFELKKHFSEVMRILTSANLSGMQDTMFAWEHLKDKVDLCCLLISGSSITITPPFIPINSLPYFNKQLRRIYLSGTLSASDAFTRAFGRVPDQIIAPTTTAGECERLILIPSRIEGDNNDLEIVQELIKEYKTLVLVPTYARAKKWDDLVVPPPKGRAEEYVESFKETPINEKLLLIARYDGIDLPGDTCRLMVIDDLPMGLGPLERYIWEYLNLSNSTRSAIASRIVQSFGRISRGMSDHGVVFLTGEKLIQWLIIPRNAAMLPIFLQKQILLGLEVSEQALRGEELAEAIDKCLSRETDWIDAYSEFMEETEPDEVSEDTKGLTEIAQSESDFANHMWNRDYALAVKALKATLEKAFKISSNTGAWHMLWLGSAFELMDDNESAVEMYSRAHGVHKNIPALPSDGDIKKLNEIPEQVCEVDRQFQIHADGKISVPKNIHIYLAHLDGSGSPAQTEESLRALGQYLGLTSTRPDKEFDTGPDVLWVSPNLLALCMDAKTDKLATSEYKKDEIGQLSDHIQWVKNNTDAEEIVPILVGPISPATTSANPPNTFKVIELEQFRLLAERLIAALTDIASNSIPINLRNNILEVFETRGLLWPKCFDDLESHKICDL
ncbi:MAG: DEAD/DEAH box helicase family protein [Nitrospira sp.]|nr:DEAD/DEAH box helicase family protein [Candidatus Brocadiales bacterium]MBL7049113.1 DEAD/DEAH box helicase family protein [Nitrospira sp.]